MTFLRKITPLVEDLLSWSPVVLITGARQSGKTTLVKMLAEKHGYAYQTFDDIRTLDFSEQDPIGFIESLRKPVILDEAQRNPELFLSIKKYVDEHRTPGGFILTGSANPLLLPKLGDSLAGRMAIVRMHPLSVGEIEGKEEHFIEAIFQDTFSDITPSVSTRESLLQAIVRGGFPPVQALSSHNRDQWFSAYLSASLQRDIQDLSNIDGLRTIPRLMQLMAARAGNLLSYSELSRTSGIATSTLQRYMTLLETLFMVHLQQSWSMSATKRMVKAPKLYLEDTGLLCHLLGIDETRLARDSILLGGIFENFVVNQLCKQLSWGKQRIVAFHYRTQTNIEVDIILEHASGKKIGIEVKSSETVRPEDFKGLRHLVDEAPETFIRGIVLYTGDQVIQFGKNMYALPVSALWSSFKISDR